MIQIEDPPDTRACSTCMKPLTHIWVYHLSRVVSVVPADGPDRWTFRLHTCPPAAQGPSWRYVQRQDPETARRGARRARAALKNSPKSKGDHR